MTTRVSLFFFFFFERTNCSGLYTHPQHKRTNEQQQSNTTSKEEKKRKKESAYRSVSKSRSPAHQLTSLICISSDLILRATDRILSLALKRVIRVKGDISSTLLETLFFDSSLEVSTTNAYCSYETQGSVSEQITCGEESLRHREEELLLPFGGSNW